jgi:hypothetical protein
VSAPPADTVPSAKVTPVTIPEFEVDPAPVPGHVPIVLYLTLALSLIERRLVSEVEIENLLRQQGFDIASLCRETQRIRVHDPP